MGFLATEDTENTEGFLNKEKKREREKERKKEF